MAKAKTVAKAKTGKRAWTATEMKEFRALAKQGLSGSAIAKKLKRSAGATYQRASLVGIRLKARRGRR
jgi:hypothetical protein